MQDGATALAEAASLDHTEIVRLLMERRADVHCRDEVSIQVCAVLFICNYVHVNQ